MKVKEVERLEGLIERMIERWRRDWVGFGERGARERGKIEKFPLRPQTVPDSEQPLEKSFEGMIERWRIDWIGFGEKGARERES